MARMQQWEERERERERWSEPEEERWPQVRPEDRDGGRDFRPIVNPYAVVALVAALLALFPIAIIFGLIAFSHPKGKGMASLALLLGAAEVAAIAGFIVLGGHSLTDGISRDDLPIAAQTTALPATTPAVATTAPSTPQAVPTAAVAATTQIAARKGTDCLETQVGAIGHGADGGTLLCLAVSGSTGGYQWAGPYNVGTGQFDTGAKCDPSVSKTGRTADGRALVCEGTGRSGSWVYWTE
ncbi:hypothetical protein [Nocardia sp. NPDC005366]|uniref:hypothetical protein n=1 Tax=Nocardia sp. NPDC005366 TaxID=3156878 RepID=UPI0033B6BC01